MDYTKENCGANMPPWTLYPPVERPGQEGGSATCSGSGGRPGNESRAELADVDDFDFICHVAFDKTPDPPGAGQHVKKRDFSAGTAARPGVLEALLDKYMNTGIYEIEKTRS